MSDCADLIGVPYVYGDTDCIWLTLTALERMGISAPAMNRSWYEMPSRRWARDLIGWGKRIKHPSYDGDVLLQAAPNSRGLQQSSIAARYNISMLQLPCTNQQSNMFQGSSHNCKFMSHQPIP